MRRPPRPHTLHWPEEDITTVAARDARSVCLAQLSLIHLAPPDLVRVAADAGFDGVLARLQRTSDGRGHDVLGDRAMVEATRRAVDETGVRVWDTEVIRLRPDTQ